MKRSVNQYGISQALGSQVQSVRSFRFGGFGVLAATAEVLRTRSQQEEAPTSSVEKDKRIVDAFEDVRNGVAPDHVLWSKQVAQKFIRRCRELNLDLPEALLKRRLITIRKAPDRYSKLGIVISPSTRKDAHPELFSRDVYAIEFALVRLKYRYGTSIDDILLESEFGDKFDRMVKEVGAISSPEALRLGALNLRKTRYFSKKKIEVFEQLDLDLFEEQMTNIGRLSEASLCDIPSGPGIAKIVDSHRYLFVADQSDLRAFASPFLEGDALGTMGDRFWTPVPEDTYISLYEGAEFVGTAIKKWNMKLIHERKPVFNWPVVGRAA